MSKKSELSNCENQVTITFPTGLEIEKQYICELIFDSFWGLKVNVKFRENVKNITITLINNKSIILPDIFFENCKKKWLNRISLPSEKPFFLDLKEYGILDISENSVPFPYFDKDIREDVTHNIDIIGNIFFFITGYEEVCLKALDDFGRFNVENSFLVKNQLNERALVNEYLEILWLLLYKIDNTLYRKKRYYQLNISHDVDIPYATLNNSFYSFLKSLIADIIYRQSLSLMLKRLTSKFLSYINIYYFDPNNNYNFLMDVSDKLKIKNKFYFIPIHRNLKYDSHGGNIGDKPILKIISNIHKKGHEIGVHPSFDTYNNFEKTQEEVIAFKNALKSVSINQNYIGGRQHYLRWVNPYSWAIWDKLELSYDSSVGYSADGIVGFRYGICYSFKPFDLLKRQSFENLEERPLIVMDVNLFRNHFKADYSKESLDKILKLNLTCKYFNGDFNILFHNNSIISPYQKTQYELLINKMYKS